MSAVSQWWQDLQARERVLVVAGIGAVLATLYWLALVEPLTARATRLEKSVAAERETQAWLAAQRPHIVAAPSMAPRERLPDGASLLAAVNDSAATSGVATHLTRITPAGPRGATLSFSGVPYADFMQWLLGIDARYGANVERIRVERADTPGIVNVELALAF